MRFITIRDILLRSTTLGGAAAIVLSSSSPAEAAIINGITNLQATSTGGSCRISWDESVTGDTDDGGGIDFYTYRIADAAGNQVPGVLAFTQVQTFGTTSTFSRLIDVTIPVGTQRYDKYLRHTDIGVSNAVLGNVILPDNMLEAAGGACLNLRVNNEPTADAGSNISTLGSISVSLAGSGNDFENDPLSFQWTQTAGPAVSLTGANTLAASFIAPPKIATPQILTFSLVANDLMDSSDPSTVDVTVLANVGPTANAGPDASAGGGTLVTLDATSSTDADGDPLIYSWTQTGGSAVTLNGANTANPTFTAPVNTTANQVLTFALTVSDGIASAGPDTVEITIPPNAAPTVNAGADFAVAGGNLVTLTGTSADLENDPLTYQWTQLAGPAVVLAAPTTLNPTFTAPPKTNAVQSLSFELVANDGTSTSSPDTITVDVAANIGTTAVATAPTQVAGGTSVTIDGSASTDGDGDTVTFGWTQLSGTPVTLNGASTAQPTFTAPPRNSVSQPLVFQLVTDDGFGGTDSVQVTITVPANGAPVANAGPDQTVPGSSLVMLDASATTDLEGDPLTFTWSQTAGPSVTLSNAAAIDPTFTAPAKLASVQTLTFSLDVTDGIDPAVPDTVDIIIAANLPPTTNAGADITSSGGAVVTLVGSDSTDADGDALTYAWTQTGGPAVTLSDATAANPTFTAPMGNASAQTLTFQLVVSDGTTSGAADQVVVSINPNTPPVADAGADIGPIDGGQTVVLSGAASSDIENNALTYLWTQVSGTPVVLSDATTVSPTFVAPLVTSDENLVFQLVVNDGSAGSLPDTVIVAVRSTGTVRIVQHITGEDTQVSFTSDIAALTGTLTTQNGSAELVASSVPVGAYTITAGDLSAAGFALTGISCSDSDSVVNLSTRSVNLALSPGEVLTCTFTSTNTRSAAEVAIETFLTGRNALLLANEPDSGRRIARLMDTSSSAGRVSVAGLGVPGTSVLPLSLSVGPSGGNFSTSLSQVMAATGRKSSDRPTLPLDFWTEVNIGTAKFGNKKHDYQLVYLGADYLLQKDLLIGLMGTIDNVGARGGSLAGSVEGHGWLVGPYLTSRLAPNVFADARAAWGRSDNTVMPLGTFRDDFTTSRALYSAALSGVFDLDATTRFRPEVSLRYISEQQKTYRDSFNVSIPGRTVDQGEFAFSPRLDKAFGLGDGWTLQPYIAADGIYAFGVVEAVGLSDGLRARAEVGTSLSKQGGLRFDISVTQDGIGAEGHKSTGAIISISKAF